MVKDSKISWTDNTFNPIRGCTKVSAGCTNCYADTFSRRKPSTLGVFGTEAQGGIRVLAARKQWNDVVKWNQAAACDCGVKDDGFLCNHAPECPQAPENRPRIFCASLGDVFENWPGMIHNSKGETVMLCPNGHFNATTWLSVPESITCTDGCGANMWPMSYGDVRRQLFSLIDATQNLDWLLLTKRPENILLMWPNEMQPGLQPPIKAIAPLAVKEKRYRRNVWLGTSCEAQSIAIDRIEHLKNARHLARVLFLSCEPLIEALYLKRAKLLDDIDWVIDGCESGPGARPAKDAWYRRIMKDCQSCGVPYFHKQQMVDGKLVKEIHEFPENLQVQEFPFGQKVLA